MRLRHSEEDFESGDFVPPELRNQSYEPADIEAPEMIPSGELAGVDEAPAVAAAPSPQGPSREDMLRKVLEQQQAYDGERSKKLAGAARKDRKAQSSANIREYLRAAFTRQSPQLRNVGQSHTQEAMAEGNSGPLSRELQLQTLLSKYETKPEDAELRAAKLRMLGSQSSMYDRANQPKPPVEPKPVKEVDEETRQADIRLKNARADYLKRPKGAGKGGGGQPLNTGMVETLANFEPAYAGIDHAVGKFAEYDVGGVRGSVGGAMPKFIKTDANKYFDDIRAAVQMVGTILEGGKLAAGDEEKYQNMFPRPGDTPGIAKAKADNLKALLKTKEGALRKGLNEQGYKAGNVATEPPRGVTVKDLSDGSTISLTAEEWAEVQNDPDWKKKVEVMNGR